MKDARYQEIADLMAEFNDLPDGAFIAVMAERGVDTDDLYEYSKEYDKRERKVRDARRKGRR